LSASGLDGQEIERRIMLAPYPSKLRKMPPAKREAKIAALIAENITEPCQRVAEFAVIVRAHKWIGRKGDSQRLIMQALAQIAQRVDSLTVTTSRTELSNLSTVRSQAISQHLDDLEQMGWISRDLASKYVITCRLLTKPDTSTGINDLIVSSFVSPEHSGLVEFRGLGRTAWHIYEILTAPASDSDLVERIGKHRRSITRALDKLEKAGAVQRNESGQWSRVAEFDPCATAQSIGVRHLGARRINQHAQQAAANRVELRRLARISPRPASQ
jgi:DNA-binding MarR family transcriptional regulator